MVAADVLWQTATVTKDVIDHAIRRFAAGDLDGASALLEPLAAADVDWRAAANLGTIRKRQARSEEALALFRRAQALTAPNAYLLGAMGAELVKLQRPEAAEPLLRQAIALEPQQGRHRYELALGQLLEGRLAEGFENYEHRPSRAESPCRGLAYPEWRGERLQGRSILVWGEQGLGDEIQFSRFLAPLRRMGARVTLAVAPNNVRLLGQLADKVTGRSGNIEMEPHDYWVMLGSLPHRLGVTPEALSGAPYLAPAWRGGGGGGVGIVARGNPRHPNDLRRSIHDDSLQAAFPGALALEPAADTAASLELVAGLDLLVTVDTSWAHMAGACGAPCLLLLPAEGLDWRWMRGAARSPWYESIQLVRQTRPGDWASAIREAQRLAREHLTRRRGRGA